MCVAVPCQEVIELSDIRAPGTSIRFRFSVWVGNLVLNRVGVWLSKATTIPTTDLKSNCQHLIFHRSSSQVLNKFRLFIELSSMKSCGFSKEEEEAAGEGGGRKRLTFAQDLTTRYPKPSQGVGLGILAALPTTESKPPTLTSSPPSKNLLYRISPAHKIKISWASDKQNPPMPIIPGSSAAPKRRQVSADAQKPRRCRPAVAVHSQPQKDVSAFPPADFLYACYLCRRRLSHSKDIYMYRGDMAFCSEECRYKQMASDERKERRASAAAPTSSSSSSSWCCSPMFTTAKFAIC